MGSELFNPRTHHHTITSCAASIVYVLLECSSGGWVDVACSIFWIGRGLQSV